MELSKREKQIVDILYSLGSGSVANVMEHMDDPPSYSAVRTTMNILVEKQVLSIEQVGKKYVYSPIVSRDAAGRNALKKTLNVFFEDSLQKAISTLIDLKTANLTDEDLDRLEEKIREARNRKS